MLKQPLSLGRQLFACIFVGFGFWVVTPLVVKESYCPPKAPATWTIESNRAAGTNQDDGGPIQWIYRAFKSQQPQSYTAKAKAEQGDRGWPPTWLCDETKLTDLLVAYFTYCLVIVGWFTIRSNERTQSDLQRAYIFGTPRIQHPTPAVAAQAGQIVVEVIAHNYGQGPGTITYIYGEMSLVEPTEKKAIYNKRAVGHGQAIGGMIAPTEPDGLRLPLGFNTAYKQPFFFYGYVNYDDLFRNSHTSRFCALLTPGQGGIDAAGTEAWSDWN